MLKKKLLLEKDFLITVLSIALPIAMQNIISFGVNAMDSVMLGKLGNVAVSGANLGGQPFFLLMIIGFGLAGGGSVLIAQYWGKGQRDVIKRIMRISMLFATLIAVIFTVVCFFFPRTVMRLFTTEEDVLRASASYLKVVSVGFVFYSIANNYMASLRAVENVKMSTAVYAMSFFVNVFFNYVFIFGHFGAPALGIVGAAVGTTISRFFEFGCVMVYMYFFEKKIGYKVHTMFKIDTRLISDFIKHSLPVMGNELMWGLGAVVTNMIMGRIGSTFVTANSITGVIGQLAQVFIFGIANASAVICGKIIGSGDFDRAQRGACTLLLLALLFGFFGMGLVFVLRTPFLSIYDVTSRAKEAAYNMMTVLAVIQPVRAIDSVDIVGILRGGGDTKLALILDAGSMWFINIPMGILTGLVWKIPPQYIFLAMRSGSFVSISISLPRVLSGKWIRNVTRENI